MDSIILQTLTGSINTRAKLINEDNLNSEKPSSFTATFSGVDKVYSIFPGQVIYIGVYKDLGTLSVKVSDFEIVRYLNLTDIQVTPGETFNEGTYLGVANKQYGLQFEFCSTYQGDSKYPVRLNNETYFKQNPIAVLNGKYTPTYNKIVTEGYAEPDQVVELTEEQAGELSTEMFAKPDIDTNVYQITNILDIPPEGMDELLSGRGYV